MTHWLDEIVLPDSWVDLRGSTAPDALRRQQLTEELRRELASGHVLTRAGWRVVAASMARDDVLLALDDDTAAITHLTYTRRPPERPPWPSTETAGTADELEAMFLIRE